MNDAVEALLQEMPEPTYYHIASKTRFRNELPERIIVRKDGYLADTHDGPVVDYVYVPEEGRTCKNVAELNREGVAGYFFDCSFCDLSIHASFDIHETKYPRMNADGSPNRRVMCSGDRYVFERCPRCGAKVVRFA